MKDKYIENAQTAFLRDTIKHFNLNNRSTGSKAGIEGCLYSPTETSCGCAIGRHVLNKDLCKTWDQSRLPFGILFSDGEFGQLAALGRKFLMQCQALHDLEANWTEQGLSARGWETANLICDGHGLDRNEILPA